MQQSVTFDPGQRRKIKEEGRRKKEEGRGKREEGRRKREEGRGKKGHFSFSSICEDFSYETGVLTPGGQEGRRKLTDSPLPITDSPLPIPHYRFPITDSPLPIPHFSTNQRQNKIDGSLPPTEVELESNWGQPGLPYKK